MGGSAGSLRDSLLGPDLAGGAVGALPLTAVNDGVGSGKWSLSPTGWELTAAILHARVDLVALSAYGRRDGTDIDLLPS